MEKARAQDIRSFSIFLVISLVVCIFRLPLLAPFSLHSLTVVLNFIPLLGALYFYFKFGSDKPWNRLLLNLNIFSMTYLSILLLVVAFTGLSEALATLRSLSSTTLFLLFPLFLDKILTKEEIEKILSYLVPLIIIIALGLTLTEFVLLKSKHVTANEISLFLLNKPIIKPTRIVTFMGAGALSILSIIALYSYIFDKTLKIYQEYSTINPLNFLCILLGFICMLLSDSLTLNLAAFILSSVSLLVFLKNSLKGFKIDWKAILLIVVSTYAFYKIAIYLLVITRLGHRYMAYFYYGEGQGALDAWFPKVSNCNISHILTGFPTLLKTNLDLVCMPGEFHSMTLAFKYGFGVQLAWFIFILFPVFYFFKNIKNYFKFPSSFYGAVALLLPMSHYSGVEIWGNNYIAAIFIVLLMKSNFREKKA